MATVSRKRAHIEKSLKEKYEALLELENVASNKDVDWILSMYLINTYRKPAKLFISGGGTILSNEGTTQGDPFAMPWYSLSTVTIIDSLRIQEPSVKQVWLADDAASAGKIKSLHSWYQNLEKVGNRFGYYVNRSKSWLIVKTAPAADEARKIFANSVNITTDGKRHLGAVIGSDEYKSEYCEGLVNNWVKELTN